MQRIIYFHHATLLTPCETISDGTLIVEGSRIAAVEAGFLPAPSGAQTIDLSGLILAPGWIDIQINGAFGVDFTEAPEQLYVVASGLTRFGVTSFLPTVITSPLERIATALRVWQQGPPPGFRGAIPLGYHLEGPMINPEKKGAHNPAYIQPLSLSAIRDWSPAMGVRLVTLAPELPGALEIIQALRRQGVVISAGHSLASYEQALQAFEAGLSCGTHLFNAMPSLDHRAPGLTGALLTQPDIAVGVIVDGIHVHPAMVEIAWRAKGADNLILVTDAMAALGMPAGKFRLAESDVIVDERSARLPNGTLAGSILTLENAVRNLQTFTRCTLNQALACCSLNPAKLLGLHTKGRLAAGMDADLVVLDPDGHAVGSIVMGEICYSSVPQLVEEV